jgi:hypothetical protein
MIDAERVIVIGLRMGASMNLKYRWYQRSEPKGESLEILLNHGDMYIMSHKATGNDWLKKIIPTLRHSEGCPKYTKDSVKKKKK